MNTQNQKNERESLVKSEEIILGPHIKPTQDKKSGARIINFPFEFPDQVRGVIIVCRVEDENWIPMKDIKSIIINFL